MAEKEVGSMDILMTPLLQQLRDAASAVVEMEDRPDNFVVEIVSDSEKHIELAKSFFALACPSNVMKLLEIIRVQGKALEEIEELPPLRELERRSIARAAMKEVSEICK